MAVTTTSRFGFKKYGAGTDPYPTRVEFNALMDLHELNAAMYSQGTTAARPAAGKAGRIYWDTTVSRLYYDTGTAWQEVTTNGAGGGGANITPGVAGVEGSSTRSARADHTHNLVLATGSLSGAMAAADKTKLDGAVSAATASKLVVRDAAGRAQFASPSAAADVAIKSYVDAETAKRALAAHTHDGADITTGTISDARIANATALLDGLIPKADKAKLDGAVSAPTASKLVSRDAAGRAQFADPAVAADVASKGYVDTGLSGKAASTHAHAFNDLTGRPASYPSTWDGTTGKPTIFATNWANVADIPLSFPSDWASVTGKPTSFASTWATVSGKPTTFAPSAHTHLWADLTDKPTTFAPAAHSHAWADVTGKPTTFAPSTHSHPDASATADGFLTKEDKAKLDAASSDGTTLSNLAMRSAGGNLYANNFYQETTQSSAVNSLTRRDYVDGEVAKRALTSHVHAASAVTATGSATTVQGWLDILGNENSARYNEIRTKTDYSEYFSRVGGDTNHSALRVPSNGNAFIGVYSDGAVNAQGVYSRNAAVGQYRAVWVNDAGWVGYNLSSRKYKQDERDYVVPLDLLKSVTPKWFKYKQDVANLGADAAPERVNFIAEDLHDAGLGEYVSYNDESMSREQAETINEQLMVNALWSFAQQQQAQIEALQKQVDEMRNA